MEQGERKRRSFDNCNTFDEEEPHRNDFFSDYDDVRGRGSDTRSNDDDTENDSHDDDDTDDDGNNDKNNDNGNDENSTTWKRGSYIDFETRGNSVYVDKQLGNKFYTEISYNGFPIKLGDFLRASIDFDANTIIK